MNHATFKISLLISTLLLGLSGCKLDKLTATEPAHPWVVVDRYKIDNLINTAIKKNNPYPAEIGDDEELMRQRMELQRIQSQAESVARSKCTPEINRSTSSTLSLDENAGQASMQKYRDMQLCMQQANNDPLVMQMREKMMALNKLSEKKSRFDMDLRTISKTAMDKVMEAFAKEKGYRLILSKNNDSILFNADMQILDVTDELANYIDQHPIPKDPQ